MKLLDPPVLTICTSTNHIEALYKVSSLYDQPSQRRSEHKLFQTLHPSWIHHNSWNYWILLSWQYAHLLIILKHCTKFQVSMISHLRGEVSTSYFKPSTPLGSTITHEIIGSSFPDNMHIYLSYWNIVQSFKSLWSAISEEKWAQVIPNPPPILDPP
jgi:hypothetical protein